MDVGGGRIGLGRHVGWLEMPCGMAFGEHELLDKVKTIVFLGENWGVPNVKQKQTKTKHN